MQSNLYLQRAIRRDLFKEIHRSLAERAGETVPDNDQYRPFLAHQRDVLAKAFMASASPSTPRAAAAAVAPGMVTVREDQLRGMIASLTGSLNP